MRYINYICYDVFVKAVEVKESDRYLRGGVRLKGVIFTHPFTV